MEYNQAQEEAINTIEGALLIISCPGSGKTTTMLRRIARMRDSGIPDSQILMVTFTEAAAKEMRERFEKQYGTHGVTFSTIHSLCRKIIRSSGDECRIADEQELLEIIRDAVKRSGVYLETFKNIRDDISRFRNTGNSKDRSEEDVNDRQFMDIVKYYENGKKTVSGYDFDDLLIVAKELLEKDNELRESFSDRYRYIICDEYQDTNPVQKDVLYLLARKYGNFCVVGDDDQSIYGFRGATPDLMMDFPKDFPSCKVIRMGTNYRSLPSIIDPSGMLIGKNKKRFAKEIKAAREGRGEIFFDSSDTREEELKWLSDLIKERIKKGGDLKDLAVLARTNQELEELAEIFTKEKIPYHSKDVLSDTYESWMFKDICTYLKIATGKYTRQDLMRIANRPKRYLDMRTLSSCELSKQGILDAYRFSKAYIIDALYDFFNDMNRLHKLPFKERVKYIVERVGYQKYVENASEAMGASTTINLGRLKTFIEDSAKFESANEWLAYARQHIHDFRKAAAENAGEGVLLATMHSSKGLEWDTVYIIDCCDNNVPLVYPGKATDMEEERRLFYVACTRAKNELHVLSYNMAPNAKGEMKRVPKSQFMEELKDSIKDMEKEKRIAASRRDTCIRALRWLNIRNTADIRVGLSITDMDKRKGEITDIKEHSMYVRYEGMAAKKIYLYDKSIVMKDGVVEEEE